MGTSGYEITKTQIWYNVKTINDEIQKYSYVFYNGDFKNVNYGSITSIGEGPFDNITSNKALVVSQIKNGNYIYIVIVNSDPFNETKLRINLIRGYETKYVWSSLTSNITVPTLDPSADSYILDVTLEPGGYAILRWR